MSTEDPLRGTGRTTGLMMAAIGSALQKPDEWVAFQDHAPRYGASLHLAAGQLRGLCRSLNLTIDVEVDGGAVRLTSPVSRMRAGRLVDLQQQRRP